MLRKTPGLGLSLREDRSALSGYPGNKLSDQWSAEDKREDLQPGELPGLTIFKTAIPAQRVSVEWEEFTIGPLAMYKCSIRLKERLRAFFYNKIHN